MVISRLAERALHMPEKPEPMTRILAMIELYE